MLTLFDPAAAAVRLKNNRSRWTLWESFFVQRFGKFSLKTPNNENWGMF